VLRIWTEKENAKFLCLRMMFAPRAFSLQPSAKMV
jgi:hypothetical protein